MSARPRAGDPARAGILLAAIAWAVLDSPGSALGLVLVIPPAFALRLLVVPRWLDGALCTVLLTAQLGSAAGLTEGSPWWDGAAHLVTGALVAILAISTLTPRPALAVGVVALLGIGWEAVEWACDAALGTNLAPSWGDTLSDLGLDLTGAVIAVAASRMVNGRAGRSPQTRRPTPGRSPAA